MVETNEIKAVLTADISDAEKKLNKFNKLMASSAKAAEAQSSKIAEPSWKKYTGKVDKNRMASLWKKYPDYAKRFDGLIGRDASGARKATLSPEMATALKQFGGPKPKEMGQLGVPKARESMYNFRRLGAAKSDAEIEKEQRAIQRAQEKAARDEAKRAEQLAKQKERAQREAERAERAAQAQREKAARLAEREAARAAKAKAAEEKAAAKRQAEAVKGLKNPFESILPEKSFGGMAGKLATGFTESFGVEKAEALAAAIKRITVGLEAAKVAAKGFARLTPFPRMAASIKDATKHLSNFGRTLKRIILVRAIRAAITAVMNGWKEGLTNLYHYSQQFGTTFKSSMDSIATDLQYVHNGLAAMAAPIINVITPAVMNLAQRFVDLANAAGLFFAKITGAASFSAAIRGAKAFKELGGAAKEAKKQLMGFDELNVMTAPSGGGGGGAAYDKMFEEWSTAIEPGSIEERIKMAIETHSWNALGIALADKLNEVVAAFDASGFGEKIGAKINAGLTVLSAFISRFSFKNAGAALAKNLNGTIKNIDFENVGSILAADITTAFDFLRGFIETFDFSAGGAAIGNVIKGWFNHLSDWLNEVNWIEFGKTFFNKVYDFVTGIDFAGVARSFFGFFGTALSEAWDFALGGISALFTKVSDYFKKKTEECGGNAFLGFLKGVTEKVVGIFTWIHDNIVKPFLDGLTGNFKTGAEDGGEMGAIGKAVIDGFFKGLTTAWTTVATWVEQKVTWFKNKFQAMKDWLTDKSNVYTPSMQNGLNTPRFYASGGTVPTGQLFVANEAGPELVGSVGGKTTVTSQDQFTAGMVDIMDNTNTVILQAAQGIIQAVINKDMTVINTISDRAIVNAYDRGKRLGGTGLATGSGIV